MNFYVYRCIDADEVMVRTSERAIMDRFNRRTDPRDPLQDIVSQAGRRSAYCVL